MSFEEFLRDDRARVQTEYDFLGASPYVPFSERMKKFFWIARPGRTDDVAAYVQQIVAFVRDQFSYEPGVTRVHSTVDEILTIGAGVCQDFAHLTIAILRLAGVPARYVSGYLAPPPGFIAAGAAGIAGESCVDRGAGARPGMGRLRSDPRMPHRHAPYQGCDRARLFRRDSAARRV